MPTGSLHVPNLLHALAPAAGPLAVDVADGPPGSLTRSTRTRSSARPASAGCTSSSPARTTASGSQREFGFHSLDIEDVASRNQRPKLDAYDDYLFIVLHFPVFDKPSGRLLTAELDLFVGPDYLITLPDQDLPPLAAMFERYREREEVREATFSKGTGLPAVPDRRHLRRRVVPDAAQAGRQARRARGRHLRRDGPTRSSRRSRTPSRRSSTSGASSARCARCCATSSARSSATSPTTSTSTSTTSPTRPSGSGTSSRTTRRSPRRSRTPNESVLSHRLNATCACSPRSASRSCPLTLVASICGMNVELPGRRVARRVLAPRGGDDRVHARRAAIYMRRRGWL